MIKALLEANGHRIITETLRAKSEVAVTRAAMREGNMGVVAGVVSIVAVIVTLLVGTILAGSFTTVATSSNLGLDSNWTAAVEGIGNTAITSMNIAALLPVAIVAGLIISVISVVIVTR